MRRKRTPAPSDAVPRAPVIQEPLVISQTLIEEAKRAIESDRMKKPARCSVCGEDCAPNSNEGLCWVCRRLKLSAWRDSDAQLPAQE